jgi:plastocyanin
MNRIQYPPYIATYPHFAAAMFAVVLSLAGVASAHAMSLARAHTSKKGHLTIMASTEVGGTILQAGEYEVREAKSSSGPVIEFVQQFHNESSSELVQADQEKVVARMQFTKQELNSPSKQTELMLASWYSTEAIGVEIRGNAVGYVFAAPQLVAQATSEQAQPTAAVTLVSAETVQASIDNFAFAPKQLTVKAGTTVVWTNKDDTPHTVTSDDGAFSSPVMDTDQNFHYTFDKPGKFPFHCKLHPTMTGVVVVQ